jgi:hypothetical protein
MQEKRQGLVAVPDQHMPADRAFRNTTIKILGSMLIFLCGCTTLEEPSTDTDADSTSLTDLSETAISPEHRAAVASVDNAIVAAPVPNTIPKFSNSGVPDQNSLLFDNGTNIGIGTTTPSQRLTLGSGNLLLPVARGGLDGNLYFGGITDVGEVGLRLFGGKSMISFSLALLMCELER